MELRTRQLLNKCRPLVVALLEPFLSENKCLRWARWMKLTSFVNNAKVGGKIWLFWDGELEFDLVSLSDQAVSGCFSHGNLQVLATFVYASCFRNKRLEPWEFLGAQDLGCCPWFIGGDFNIIQCNDDKVGGIMQASSAKAEFNACIQHCGLLDLPYEGNRLLWVRRQIWARLDRVLVNMPFLNLWET